MKQPFCLFIAAITTWCISPAVSAQPVSPKTLDDIFAPVVVGTPPVDAFNGLFRCPDGEIRHYGDDGFLSSRDNGLTWKHRRFGEVDASGKAAGGGRPLGMNPKTGTCLRLVGGKGGMFVHRSTDGPDGKYTVQKIDDRSLGMVRPPYFLQSRPRVLFAAHGERPERITVFRSDDDGLTWAKTTLPPGPAFVVEPPHKGPTVGKLVRRADDPGADRTAGCGCSPAPRGTTTTSVSRRMPGKRGLPGGPRGSTAR